MAAKGIGEIMKDAFGIEISKATKPGGPGDKKKTKYAASAYGGATVGSIVGRTVGPRAHKTTTHSVYDQTNKQIIRQLPLIHSAVNNNKRLKNRAGVLFDVYRGMLKVPGSKALYAADIVGSVVGAGAGAAAYAHHRNKKYGKVSKSFDAFGVERIAKAYPNPNEKGIKATARRAYHTVKNPRDVFATEASRAAQFKEGADRIRRLKTADVAIESVAEGYGMPKAELNSPQFTTAKDKQIKEISSIKSTSRKRATTARAVAKLTLRGKGIPRVGM